MGFGVLSLALVGASCNGTKKEVGPTEVPRPDAQPAVEEEIPGVDLAGLKPDERQQFFRLVDSAPSPCGKPHSLRVSLKTDRDCRRSLFAARYIKKLAAFGAEDEDVLKTFKARYDQEKPVEIDLTGVPYNGVPNAPVVIVEFFDYSCPHCKLALPMLEDAVAEFPSDVVVYYMNFPLGGGHPHSMALAQAAVAAQKQGRFREMHKKLFAAQDGDQSETGILAIARGLGLDMPRFEADFKDPKTIAIVTAQRKQGEKIEIDGTPAIYINGRTYRDVLELEWLKSWIDEEIAVTR